MADETSSNLTPAQMAAALALKCQRRGCFGVRSRSISGHPLLGAMDALLSHASELREFIEANKSRLKTKDQTKK
jgi:hypothetical protein